MDAFIEGLNFNSTREASGESFLYLLKVSGAADMWNIEAYEASVETNNPRYISVIGYSEEDASGAMMKVVVYSPDAMTLESIALEKGWSEITFASSTRGRKKSDSDRIAKLKQHVYSVLHGVKLREGDAEYSVTVVKLNQLTTYTHEDVVGTVVSTDSQFASLNGTVFGSVEGEEPVVSTHTITTTVTNGTYSGDTEITDGGTASVTISADSGYDLPSTVSATGATASYDSTTGVISLSEPTGNVTIIAECTQQTPTPSLTPISVGQTITGIDFGNVQNGDTNADLDAFLAGLTYTDMGGFDVCSIVGASNGAIAMAISTDDWYVITSVSGGDAIIIYATAAGIDLSSIGISDTSTLGYQNLTSGKIAFGTSVEVATVSDEQGWNGILMGAVEGQAQNQNSDSK